jgi:hypothetical protein
VCFVDAFVYERAPDMIGDISDMVGDTHPDFALCHNSVVVVQPGHGPLCRFGVYVQVRAIESVVRSHQERLLDLQKTRARHWFNSLTTNLLWRLRSEHR